MSRLEAKEVLSEAYDVTFGIFDHLRQAAIEQKTTRPELKRPLASIALHPAEAFASKGTELYKVLEGFAENEVGDTFKISLPEFLDLPVEYAQALMSISKKRLERKSKQVDSQQASLEAAANAANMGKK